MTAEWRNEKTNSLFEALLQPKTVDEMAAFCRDLMTEPEIQEFASRWQVAVALDRGYSQRQIADMTKVSIATVTRVNQWLRRGMGGYMLVLARWGKHHHTIPGLAVS